MKKKKGGCVKMRAYYYVVGELVLPSRAELREYAKENRSRREKRVIFNNEQHHQDVPFLTAQQVGGVASHYPSSRQPMRASSNQSDRQLVVYAESVEAFPTSGA